MKTGATEEQGEECSTRQGAKADHSISVIGYKTPSMYVQSPGKVAHNLEKQ